MNLERVVLLDEQGRRIGTADKTTVHHAATPLHLAFSCYLFDAAGSVLVTRRARSKRTWPGVVTNSCCGHPAPGEPIEDAVRRRVRYELGADLADLVLLLPRFRYRAELEGVVEHEMCPVYAARATGAIRADVSEVAETAWTPWAAFRDGVLDGSWPVSPWCRDQVALLPAVPWTATARPPEELPPAAREPGRPG